MLEIAHKQKIAYNPYQIRAYVSPFSLLSKGLLAQTATL